MRNKHKRHGMGGWTSKRGQGRGSKLIREVLISAPPECVIWPMFRDVNGYGRVGFEGKQCWAHRLVCELAHGPAPSPDHEATHACGNGKGGCYNPRHLMWGTRTRNQLDRASHGTKAKGIWKHRPKLNAAMVLHIVRLNSVMTQRELANEFGVTDATIRDVLSGKTWGHITGIMRAAA